MAVRNPLPHIITLSLQAYYKSYRTLMIKTHLPFPLYESFDVLEVVPQYLLQ